MLESAFGLCECPIDQQCTLHGDDVGDGSDDDGGDCFCDRRGLLHCRHQPLVDDGASKVKRSTHTSCCSVVVACGWLVIADDWPAKPAWLLAWLITKAAVVPANPLTQASSSRSGQAKAYCTLLCKPIQMCLIIFMVCVSEDSLHRIEHDSYWSVHPLALPAPWLPLPQRLNSQPPPLGITTPTTSSAPFPCYSAPLLCRHPREGTVTGRRPITTASCAIAGWPTTPQALTSTPQASSTRKMWLPSCGNRDSVL